MRESIGGVWLISIVITFITLFAAFLAYAISYTKAFNAKNYIINLIERSEGWTESPDSDAFKNKPRDALLEHNDSPDGSNNSVELEAYKYIRSLGYNVEALDSLMCGNVAGHHDHLAHNYSMLGGYCVTMYCPDKQSDPDGGNPTGTDSKVYYKVTTFITLEFLSASITIPVSGETRTLYHDHGDQDLKNACIKN